MQVNTCICQVATRPSNRPFEATTTRGFDPFCPPKTVAYPPTTLSCQGIGCFSARRRPCRCIGDCAPWAFAPPPEVRTAVLTMSADYRYSLVHVLPAACLTMALTSLSKMAAFGEDGIIFGQRPCARTRATGSRLSGRSTRRTLPPR